MEGHYTLKFTVDEIDLTRFVKHVDIITHASTLVPVINLVVQSDIFNVISVSNIKANSKFTIISKLNDLRQVQTDFDLVLVKTIKDVPQRNTNDQQQRVTPSTIELEASDKNAVNAASTMINYANSYVTIQEVLNDIAQKANLELVTLTDINSQIYKNIVIPPLSINQALAYLQQKYGITYGPLLKVINYKRQLVIADCSKLCDIYPKPLVLFMRGMGVPLNISMQKGGLQDGSDLEFRYSMRNNPEVDDTLSRRLIKIKPKQIIVSHPLDRFYQFSNLTASDVNRQHTISKQPLDIQTLAMNESVQLDYSIYSYNDSAVNITHQVSRELTNAKRITCHLEIFKNQNHFLYVPDEYGFVVQLQTPSIPEISGKYILASAHLAFSQEQHEHWNYELQISLRG